MIVYHGIPIFNRGETVIMKFKNLHVSKILTKRRFCSQQFSSFILFFWNASYIICKSKVNQTVTVD